MGISEHFFEIWEQLLNILAIITLAKLCHFSIDNAIWEVEKDAWEQDVLI